MLKARSVEWQRERHKTIGLISKTKTSARFTRAFYVLVHFFAVLCKTDNNVK